MSERLKRIECEKKAFLDEQAKKEEQFRLLELERQTLLEIERKVFQEEQDRLLAQQLNDQFNNMHISGGKNYSPFTPAKTPKSRRHSRTPSQSPSPRGRRASRHDHYRRRIPLRNLRQHSQRAHHDSKYRGNSSSFDLNSQDFMKIQQDPLF